MELRYQLQHCVLKIKYIDYVINARYTYARKRKEHVSGVVRNEGEFAKVKNLLNFRQKVASGQMYTEKQPAIKRFQSIMTQENVSFFSLNYLKVKESCKTTL